MLWMSSSICWVSWKRILDESYLDFTLFRAIASRFRDFLYLDMVLPMSQTETRLPAIRHRLCRSLLSFHNGRYVLPTQTAISVALVPK